MSIMKKILLYGINELSDWYFHNYINSYDVIGFVETNKKIDIFFDKKVYSVNEINQIDFDEIHILNSYSETIHSAKEVLASVQKIVLPLFLCNKEDSYSSYSKIVRFCRVTEKCLYDYCEHNDFNIDITVRNIIIKPNKIITAQEHLKLKYWCNIYDSLNNDVTEKYISIINKERVPKIDRMENFFFDLDNALKHKSYKRFALVFFMGIGDYFFATQFLLQLKNIFSSIKFDAYVSRTNDNNNSKFVYDCLLVNSCFESVYYYDGFPDDYYWVNYNYQDVYSKVDKDTLVIPLVYLSTPNVKSRYLDLCRTFNITPYDRTPVPKVLLDYEPKECVLEFISYFNKMNEVRNYKGIIWLQLNSRSYKYSYKDYKKLIELLSKDNWFIIYTDPIDYIDENLYVIDHSRFNINDSIKLLYELSRNYRVYGLGVTSCFAAISSGLNIPYLTIHTYYDDLIESVWHPNEKIITFKEYPSIPACNQYICPNSEYEYTFNKLSMYYYPVDDIYRYFNDFVMNS